MNRRTFLKNTVYASLLPLLGGVLMNACTFRKGKGKKIFVLVQLVGGNDGLNTLIPLDNYSNLVKARPNLYIPDKKIIPISGKQVGLHPAMAGLKELFDAKQLSFLQGVGYENPSYSHFRSTDIWLTGAEASKTLYTGWMGRYLESKSDILGMAHPPAIKIGETGSLLFEGTNMDVGVVIPPAAEDYRGTICDPLADTLDGYALDELQEIQATLRQSGKYSKVLDQAIKESVGYKGPYPEAGKNPLADQLKMVAQLVDAELQTPVYHVELKGFDTHSEQVDKSDTTKGMHADLLSKLSEALTAFWNDITRMGKEDEVLVMVFSEFGRRIGSNSSYGTDHGSAQPLMFLGKGLNPGVLGENPVIGNNISVSDNLHVQTDFKAVYAAVLKDWFGSDDKALGNVLNANIIPVDLFAKSVI